MSAFEKALELTLRYEGGFADDPDDPGGRTMKGITERVYHAWLTSRSRPLSDVRDISDEDVASIYRERYWEDGMCSQIPDLLAITHFDACVNHGIRQATKFLQRATGSPDDGMWGEMTRAAVDAAVEDRAVREYNRRRIDFYLWLWMRRSNMRKFMGGWVSRVRHLEDAVLDRPEWR